MRKQEQEFPSALLHQGLSLWPAGHITTQHRAQDPFPLTDFPLQWLGYHITSQEFARFKGLLNEWTQITFSKAWQVPRRFCKKKRRELMASAICSLWQGGLLSACGWLAPLSRGRKGFFLFTQHQASDSDQGKCCTPGFRNIRQRSVSLSMYNTLEGLLKEVNYFSSLKEGDKMTVLWLADRPPLLTGHVRLLPT